MVQLRLVGDLLAHFSVGVNLGVEINTNHIVGIVLTHGTGHLLHTGPGQRHGKGVAGLSFCQRVIVGNGQHIVGVLHQHHRCHGVVVGALHLHLHITQKVQPIVHRIGNHVGLTHPDVHRNRGADDPCVGLVSVHAGLVVANGDHVLFDVHIALDLVLGLYRHLILPPRAIGAGGRQDHIEGRHRRADGGMRTLHHQIHAVRHAVLGQAEAAAAIGIGFHRVVGQTGRLELRRLRQHHSAGEILLHLCRQPNVKFNALQRHAVVAALGIGHLGGLVEVERPLKIRRHLGVNRQLAVVHTDEGLGRAALALGVKQKDVRHGLHAVNGQLHAALCRSGRHLVDDQRPGVGAVFQCNRGVIGAVIFQHGAQRQGVGGRHLHIHHRLYTDLVRAVSILTENRAAPALECGRRHGDLLRRRGLQIHQIVVCFFNMGLDQRLVGRGGIAVFDLGIACIIILRGRGRPLHVNGVAEIGERHPLAVGGFPHRSLGGGHRLAHRQPRHTGGAAQLLRRHVGEPLDHHGA